MSKLLFGLFDRLAAILGWLQDLFRKGERLSRLLGVVAVLIVAGSLNGTWTFEEPDPAAEQSDGLVIVLPRGTDVVRHQDTVLATRASDEETLRLRLHPDIGLPYVTQYSVAFHEDAEGAPAIPFHVRERGDIGGRVAPLENADPSKSYEIELLDTWEGGAWVEVTRTTPATDHTMAYVGLGFAVLVSLLLLLKRPSIALIVATAGLGFGVWTWKGYVPGLADSAGPQPELRVSPDTEDASLATPEDEAAPETEEVAVEDLGLDWLTELEGELEDEGAIDKQPEAAPEPEPEEEVELEGLDWLDDLEEELVAEGAIEGDDEDAPAEEEPELEGLDWLDDLEDELVAEGAIDAPDAADDAETANTGWTPALAVVAPFGAFWGWFFGIVLSFVGAAGGTIVRRENGWEIFKTRVILTLTGAFVVVEELFNALDRLVAWLERATISVFLVVMAGLSFLDYLRRETGLEVDVDGGPAMATLMMVWVGFLGASIATRRGQHLAVDATDRVLSPGAAKLAKRFSALVAAGLCWQLMGYSWKLVAEGLVHDDIAPGLPVWDFLEAPINLLVQVLPTAGAPAWGLVLGGAFVAIAGYSQLSRLEEMEGPANRFGLPVVEGVAAIAAGLAILGILPGFWDPVYEDGSALVWKPVEAGGAFPQWLGSVVIPLAFGLMAVRFFSAAVLGRFVKRELGGEAAIQPAFQGGQRTRKDMVLAALFPGILLGLGATLAWGKGSLILMAGLLLVLVGSPLFVGIGVATLACVVLINDLDGFYVAKDMFEATKKEELLAIPFFVLAGNIMTHGSLAERLINVARAAAGPIPGGLGLATIFACVIFAAISGSSPVTVIAIGGLMFPMLVKEGYPTDYSTGVLTSAGSLGIIIPPSIPMILYSIMVSADPTNPSVTADELFVAGVLPGLLIAAALVIYTLFVTRPGAGVKLKPLQMEGGYFKNLGSAMWKGLWALLLPVGILGGIYGVLGPIKFTVTEAAAAAVVYALFVELVIYRELKPKDLVEVLVESGVMMGSLFVIIVLAIAFNKFLAHQEIPQQAAEYLAMHVDSKLQFLVMVNIFLLLLGTVMEIISAILIVAPLLAPIALSYGIDPIHFGIIFIVNLELGYLTPPMGINLFVSSTVFERPLIEVIKSTIPFLVIMLICLIIIAWFPGLSTWLPELLAK